MTGWWGGWDADATVRQAMAYGASQDPAELGLALEAVRSADPVVVVEIGCDRGGTLYAWRQVCERVYGVTLADNGGATGGSGLVLDAHGATVITGNSHDRATFALLVREMRGGRWSCTQPTGEPCGDCDGCRFDAADAWGRADVLVIDGDHAAAGVRADLAMYGPLVREGGVILLHDITSVPDGMRPVEVPAVWAGLRGRYVTEELLNPEGPAQGWGLIRVAPGDDFALLVSDPA